jgi:hypothetical protein
MLRRWDWVSGLACWNASPWFPTLVTVGVEATRWSGVLALAAAAVLAGARSLTAISEWAADAPQPVLVALGACRDPLTGTRRRVAGRPAAAPGPWRRRAVAVDGKSVRGAVGDRDRAVHLVAAMNHTDGAVLAQLQVDATTNEISRFQPLLAGLDLAGVVVTADAMHTQHQAAEFLVTQSRPTTC